MLPKAEKIKKITVSDQLNLVESLDNEKKAKRKRIIVTGLLILTTGLSLGFWVYRKLGPILKRGIGEIRPREGAEIKIKYDPEKEITKIIGENQGKWYFYVKNGDYSWSKDFSGISPDETATELSKIKSEESMLAAGLPKGIKIQEKLISGGDGWELRALVTVPNKEILMVIGVSETSELSQTKALIPSLGQVLYWAGIQN